MHLSSIAPYLIAYLSGVATPILVAALFFRGQDNEGENRCFLFALLGILFLAILVLTYLWIADKGL